MMPSDNNHNNQGKYKTMKRQRKHEFIVSPTYRKKDNSDTDTEQRRKEKWKVECKSTNTKTDNGIVLKTNRERRSRKKGNTCRC